MPLLVEGGSERDVDHPGDAQDWSIHTFDRSPPKLRPQAQRTALPKPEQCNDCLADSTVEGTNIQRERDKDPEQRDNIDNGPTNTTDQHQRTNSNPQLGPKHANIQHELPVETLSQLRGVRSMHAHRKNVGRQWRSRDHGETERTCKEARAEPAHAASASTNAEHSTVNPQHPETCNSNTARNDTTTPQEEGTWEPTTPDQVETTETSHSQHEQVAAIDEYMLQEQDAEERGHKEKMSRDYSSDSSDEGPSPAIKQLGTDKPLSQASRARMETERLEQLIIIIRPSATAADNSYLFGREDDQQLRQQNARQISDAIFSFSAWGEDAGMPPLPETVAPYDLTKTDGEPIDGLIAALVSPQLIDYHFWTGSRHLAKGSNRRICGKVRVEQSFFPQGLLFCSISSSWTPSGKQLPYFS